MSTMVVEVSPEQEKALEGLFQCMEVSYQTITPKGDFWDELSANTKNRIQKGLDDVEAGRFTPFQTVIKQHLAQ